MAAIKLAWDNGWGKNIGRQLSARHVSNGDKPRGIIRVAAARSSIPVCGKNSLTGTNGARWIIELRPTASTGVATEKHP